MVKLFPSNQLTSTWQSVKLALPEYGQHWNCCPRVVKELTGARFSRGILCWSAKSRKAAARKAKRAASWVDCPYLGRASAPAATRFLGPNPFNDLSFIPTWHPDCLLRNGKCEMATIMSDACMGTWPGIASADEIRTAFTQHKQELIWLAEFLTGDEIMASACVIDARTRSENRNAITEEWFWTWPRETTIRSALDLQRVRIDQLASVYERRDRIHCQHASLSADAAELLTLEFDGVRLRLDVLCRFALILCGVEQRSVTEAAQLLGISKHAVEGAYCAALESLEVIYSQFMLEAYGCAATLN